MFALHHCSAIRLIRLDMCLVFLFASVIIVFVYDSDRYGTAATSGKELFMIAIIDSIRCFFVIGGFDLYVLAIFQLGLVL